MTLRSGCEALTLKKMDNNPRETNRSWKSEIAELILDLSLVIYSAYRLFGLLMGRLEGEVSKMERVSINIKYMNSLVSIMTQLYPRKSINLLKWTGSKYLYAVLHEVVLAELIIISLLSIADLAILLAHEPKNFSVVVHAMSRGINMGIVTGFMMLCYLTAPRNWGRVVMTLLP